MKFSKNWSASRDFSAFACYHHSNFKGERGYPLAFFRENKAIINKLATKIVALLTDPFSAFLKDRGVAFLSSQPDSSGCR
jgi:hypothetical protein